MPMEPSADSLSNTLSRLNLSSYTTLLVDDEELTSKLILTMERGAAHTSLVDVGMDGASAEKLCAALFDGVIAADDDDDALVIEDNDAKDGLVMEENDEADDDDALIIEANDEAAPPPSLPPPPDAKMQAQQARSEARAAAQKQVDQVKAVDDALAKINASAFQSLGPQAAPTVYKDTTSMDAKYTKWDQFVDDEEEGEEAEDMDGAIKEEALYEVMEKAVYVMTRPRTGSKVLEFKKKGEVLSFDARRKWKESDGKTTVEFVRLKERVSNERLIGPKASPSEKRYVRGWCLVDATELKNVNAGVLLKRISTVKASQPSIKAAPPPPIARVVQRPPPPKKIPTAPAAAATTASGVAAAAGAQKKKNLDYSKWDKFVDDEEDAELDEKNKAKKPKEKVYPLDPRGGEALDYPTESIGEAATAKIMEDPKNWTMNNPNPQLSSSSATASGEGKKKPSSSSSKSMFASDAKSTPRPPYMAPPEPELTGQAKQMQEMSQNFDAKQHHEDRIKELEAQRDRFGSAFADENLATEQLMRDAKAQGNQGNLVMDPKLGRMVIKTDDEMGGQGPNGKYWWGQNEKEVVIKCRVASHVKGKNVQLVSKSQSVKLSVNGEVVCEGKLHQPVIADESMYLLEEDKTEVGKKLLIVTMAKATPTKGHEHWSCAIQGEGKVNTSKFGVPTVTVNPNDPEEMKRVIGGLNDMPKSGKWGAPQSPY